MKAGLRLCFTIVIFLPFVYVFSQTAPSGIIAIRATEQIMIDGNLSESIWQRAGYAEFKQKDPNQGEAPSEKTEVWVAFDNEGLYVAARMYDNAPDSIMARLGRRDNFITADYFTISLDPYHDKRSGFYFTVSAAGVQYDGILENDDWDDSSWDGVWESKTQIDSQGWTVEMRIPFSQLRFHQLEKYVWGVNFKRDIGRKNERDYVVYTPRNESGYVSRFVDLVGIDNVIPPRQLEILPYATTRAEYTHPAPGNPFNSGSKYLPGLGADLKLGLSSNLTLNATINPDFGQVEVDPAVVNLSDVETFFQEKRPFFIEGSGLFSNFGFGGANNYWGFNWGSPNLFYSRRIGRAPQGSLPSADFVDSPTGTRILGAGKITGKVGDNINIGMIHAITSREFAEYQDGTHRDKLEIEPLTYYGVFRGQKEFNEGRQALGFMSTFATRNFSDNRLRDELNTDALSGGIDGWTFLDSDKMWVVTGWGAFTRVSGNPTKILALQQSSQHYYQRPDVSHVHIDSAATSLTGYAGRFYLNKQKGNFKVNAAFGFINPGFDANDLGFQWRTDMINSHIAFSYRWTEPTDYYRQINLNAAVFGVWDFGYNLTGAGYFHNGYIQFPNYYSVNWSYAYNPTVYNFRRTRGGPLTVNSPGQEYDLYINSDDRKSLVFSIGSFVYTADWNKEFSLDTQVEWKPSSNISFQISPSFQRSQTPSQWVNVFNDITAKNTFEKRYVFGELDQTTLSASIRLNWTFTPQLSLQLYVQPLISSGSYVNFKELAQPKTYDFNVYGKNSSTISKTSDGYIVDPDGNGPAPTFSFANPDFNFTSLRGNAVLRWEYRPGSTLYLVWTQNRSDYENDGEFNFNRSLNKLVSAKADNILMLKFTYWWSL